MPSTHIALSLNPHTADLQLQHAIKMAMALDPYFSAKRAHSSSADYDVGASGNSSANEFISDDESGRFDDADEEEARSVHSAKRRRSNDWPFGGNGTHSPAQSLGRRHQRRRNLSRSPLRTQVRASTSSSRDDRPRRSRFIEERMCDSISEKPPSIFTGRENGPRGGDGKGARGSNGIFRFGKAIAAAFNPFGGWRSSGSGSMEDGNGDADAEEKRNDDIAQVERAYEELKRAGIKGTAKGSYMQQAAECAGDGVHSAVADQTWRAVQEKMDHPVAGRQSSQDSAVSSHCSAGAATATPRRGSGTLFRSSLHDLRRAKSSLGIPSSKRNDSAHSHETPEWSEIRKKKSRKELQKQAKLMKKVSNLEEKLDKARRELRHIAGDEEIPADSPKWQSQSQSLCMENKAYLKRFVPGALPTLPSERLLDRHALSASPEPDPAAFTALSPKILRIPESHEETLDELQVKTQRSMPKSPKSLSKPDHSLEIPESPPRKRKSPDPAATNKPQWSIMPTQSQIPTTTSTSPRKPKHPKTGKTDSPQLNQSQSQHNPSSNSNSDRTALRQCNHKPSPPPPKRTSRSTPRLRMRKGRADLRSATTTAIPAETADDSTNQNHNHAADEPPSRGRRRRTCTSSQDHGCCEDIPPVPPIPKDIVAATTTATATPPVKVDSERPVQEQKQEQEKARKGKEKRSRKSSSEEGFKWPEEFF